MTITINLLPWRENLKEQQKKEFFTLLGVLVVFSAGLVLLIHTLVATQIQYQNENNNHLKNEIRLLDQKNVEIQKLEKEKKELLARMEVIQQLQANRPGVVELFDGIVRIVPPGLYLTSLSRTGDRILIDGKAESNTRVSTFMRNIESTHWLKSPELSLIQADEKPGDTNKPKVVDRVIGFNLQAIEVMPGAATIQPATATPTNTPNSLPK